MPARGRNTTRRTPAVEKCRDDNQEDGQHHAMLIAVRGQKNTALDMWKITKSGKDYYRVVITVPCLS